MMNFTKYNYAPGPYTHYGVKLDKERLNMSIVPKSEATVFYTDIYKKEPFPVSSYSDQCTLCTSSPREGIYDRNDPTQRQCGLPRDISTNYVYGTERTSHPLHFSRFQYPNCPNGYCKGTQTGRNYYVSPWCPYKPPANVALDKYYNYPYQLTSTVSKDILTV